MKRSSYFLLFICLISLWGCPTKKQIPQPPPPKPPEPQVQEQKPQSIYKLPDGTPVMIIRQQQLVYDWMDVIEILKGMAPLVGPAPWFFRMMA